MKRLLECGIAMLALGLPVFGQAQSGTAPAQNATKALTLLAYSPQDHDRDRDDRDRDHDRWDRDRGRAWHREHHGDWDNDRDRAWHRDYDRDNRYARPGNGYGYGRGAWQGRLSGSDQGRFNSYYDRWMQYRATNNVGEMRSMEGRMRDVYSRYGIPPNTPFGEVARR